MAKTLSESAAEILKASMNAGKEPLAAQNAEVHDLGGATNDNPAGEGVGSAAAAAVGEAPKPGQSNTDSPEKKIGSVKSQGLAKPAATDATLNPSIGEEVASEEEVIAEEGTEEVVAEAELSDEELAEAKSDWMKKKVAEHKGSMKEDVDALFNGESLSEDFRVKATLIFESAVTSRVEKVLEDVLADNDKVLEEAITEIKTEMADQVDSYLNYAVEQWMEENKVAVESGLRAEMTEEFIEGLKTLFTEHYIEIPDEKLDVAEELAARVVELEEAAAAQDAEKAALTEQLNAIKKNEAIRKICEGLTEVQIGKMKSLAESVEFTTEGDFDNKLAVIRENYFPTKVQVKSEVKAIQETAVNEEPEVVQTSGIMAQYVKSLTKTAPKA